MEKTIEFTDGVFVSVSNLRVFPQEARLEVGSDFDKCIIFYADRQELDNLITALENVKKELTK